MNFPTVSQPRALDRFSNRRTLLIGFVPILVPLLLCLFSLAKRALCEEKTYAPVSSMEASRIAGNLCEEMIGGHVSAGEANLSQGYSVRHRKPVRQWDVVCDTAQGQYLVRINADNWQVFGVNQMAGQSTPSDLESRLSRAEAEVYSRRYLALMGISPDDVRSGTPQPPEPYWNFRYRTPASGPKSHLLMVSVEARTGRLINAWNAANAF